MAVLLIELRHGKLIGRNEMERGIEMAHGHEQAMYRAPIFEVAY